jgi:putative redox protein
MIAAATKLTSARAIATIASPYTPSHVLIHVEEAVTTLEKQELTSITIMGREFDIKRAFIDDLHSHEDANFAAKLNIPLLIMHSPNDRIVAIDEASKVFSIAKHPKSFVSLGDIDHMLSEKADAEYVANLIHAWAYRYLS